MAGFNIANEMPQDWWEKVESFISEKDLNQLTINVEEAYHNEKVVPSQHQLFRAFRLTNWDNLKVVILGQDPYPTRGHAHGLSFSTEDFVQPFPRSLRNIFLELDRSLPDFQIPLTGNLENWARQGVLLLNTQLTTLEGEANAHEKLGWQNFTKAVLKAIESHKKGIIGLFWGKPAERFSALWTEKQHKLITSHPSPLSVRRGFQGCGHFVRTNELLKEQGKSPIHWG